MTFTPHTDNIIVIVCTMKNFPSIYASDILEVFSFDSKKMFSHNRHGHYCSVRCESFSMIRLNSNMLFIRDLFDSSRKLIEDNS